MSYEKEPLLITERLFKLGDTKYCLTMEANNETVSRDFHVDFESIEDVRKNIRNRLSILLDNMRIIKNELINIEQGEAL